MAMMTVKIHSLLPRLWVHNPFKIVAEWQLTLPLDSPPGRDGHILSELASQSTSARSTTNQLAKQGPTPSSSSQNKWILLQPETWYLATYHRLQKRNR